MSRIVRLALGLMILPVANAATSIQLHIKNPDNHWTQMVFVDKGKVIVQSPNADKRPALFYEQGKNQFIFIDHGRQSYLVLDGAMLDQMSAAIDAVGLGALIAKPDSEPTSYIRTGELRSINGYHCKISRITKGGQLNTELCLADSGTLPMPADDYQTFRSMLVQAWKINKKAKQLPNGLLTSLPDINLKQFDGLPIWVFNNDKQTSVMVLEISNKAFASESLSIPSGYRQVGLADLLSQWKPL